MPSYEEALEQKIKHLEKINNILCFWLMISGIMLIIISCISITKGA